MINRNLAFILLVTLCACATPYQGSGFRGGFKETQLAPDAFQISFSGNAFTSTEQVQDFALLRAAELSLQNGYPHFVVLESADRSRVQSIVTPGSSTTTGTVSAYGNTANYSSTTTTSPSQVTNLYKPGTGLTIQALKEKPASGFAFDAAFLMKSIKTKYKIP